MLGSELPQARGPGLNASSLNTTSTTHPKPGPVTGSSTFTSSMSGMQVHVHAGGVVNDDIDKAVKGHIGGAFKAMESTVSFGTSFAPEESGLYGQASKVSMGSSSGFEMNEGDEDNTDSDVGSPLSTGGGDEMMLEDADFGDDF